MKLNPRKLQQLQYDEGILLSARVLGSDRMLTAQKLRALRSDENIVNLQMQDELLKAQCAGGVCSLSSWLPKRLSKEV